MRIFDNTNQLKKVVIDRRLQAFDADAESSPYLYTDNETGDMHWYVGIDSLLSDEQIENILSKPLQSGESAKSLISEIDQLKDSITKLETPTTK